ncbi:MAG TPA: LysM peptidoglycan-binding domain-containing protein [Opitutaceae bacterium]|nr:LysM peptidoglycan-binding domain-containing protein [Opitutaceae bacterium]
MTSRFHFFGLLALCALLFAAGCERGGSLPFASEESDSDFQRGKQLIRQGRNQEALAAFLKVIAKRGDDAPESHLEAGLLYQQHIKDPIFAIYHFSKYRELQPNSKQAELVRQQIDAAKREFARTLPAHPLEDASVKLEYNDQLDRLQRENEQLKAELAALRGALPAGIAARPRSGFEIPETAYPTPRAVQVEPAPETSPILRAPLKPEPAVGSRNAAESVVRPAPNPRAGPGTTANQPPAGKRHTVQRGDTLSSLARQYYGDSAKRHDIYNANRDILKSENETLRLGMELRIP